jgi:excisionase family DNA binding protein
VTLPSLERTSSNAELIDAIALRVVDLLGAKPTPSPPVEGALLDAGGAAALLSVPASWVLAEARAERIPHVRLGRYVRFDRAELEAWAAERARGPRRRTGSGPVLRGGKTA